MPPPPPERNESTRATYNKQPGKWTTLPAKAFRSNVGSTVGRYPAVSMTSLYSVGGAAPSPGFPRAVRRRSKSSLGYYRPPSPYLPPPNSRDDLMCEACLQQEIRSLVGDWPSPGYLTLPPTPNDKGEPSEYQESIYATADTSCFSACSKKRNKKKRPKKRKEKKRE